jgi:tetratricopeptide (TPR) repeat protein
LVAVMARMRLILPFQITILLPSDNWMLAQHLLAIGARFLLVLMVISAVGHKPLEAAEILIDADRQLAYAESCFVNGEYAQALSEYQRFLYFFPDDIRKEDAQLKTGECYFYKGEYRQAIKAFRLLYDTIPLPADRFRAIEMISRSYLALGQTGSAVINYQYFIASADNDADKDAARYHLGWIYLENIWAEEKRAATPPLETAINHFNEISQDGRSIYKLDELSGQLAQKAHIPQKSPWLAGTLSVIPGGGQLYCNRYQDAVVAFLLNAGLILSAVEAFDHELYALGAVIGVVGSGFYVGNIYGAVSSAKKYNRFQKRLFVNRLKESLKIGLIGDPSKERVGASVGFSF